MMYKTLKNLEDIKTPLPKAWKDAVGLLSDTKAKKLEEHVKKTRSEWS